MEATNLIPKLICLITSVKNKKYRSQIIIHISDTQVGYVNCKGTSFNIWTILLNTFERKSIVNLLFPRKRFFLVEFNSQLENIETHFIKFDITISELRSPVATLEEIDIVCHILLTTPAEYQRAVASL